MKNTMNRLAFCLLLSCPSVYGIVIVEPSAKEAKKTYRTISELKNFFKKHGMHYLEKNEYVYKPVLAQDMKKDHYYKDHACSSDELTKKYANHVRKHHRAPIELRWVNKVVGYGVFAYKPIAKGDFIAEYTGQVMLKEQVQDTDYCWAYPPVSENGKPISCDAKYKGNEMRYVNHGNKANICMKYILVNNVWHVCYVATQDIPAGAQLLVNYGSNYWNTRSIQCQDL